MSNNGTEECVETPKLTYKQKLKFVSVIAKPMAPKSLAKKIYKLIKNSAEEKDCLRIGLKAVQKRIRLGETGMVIFAGDVSPIEIMCHMPIVCEDKDIPYCFVASRDDLGTAAGLHRSVLMVLIKEQDSYKDQYDDIKSEIKTLSLNE